WEPGRQGGGSAVQGERVPELPDGVVNMAGPAAIAPGGQSLARHRASFPLLPALWMGFVPIPLEGPGARQGRAGPGGPKGAREVYRRRRQPRAEERRRGSSFPTPRPPLCPRGHKKPRPTAMGNEAFLSGTHLPVGRHNGERG